MIAQEAKYHTQCLVSLYNKAHKIATFDQRNEDSEYHGFAFVELISYIEEARMDSLGVPNFKLTDLANMYSNRFEQLGSSVAGRVHSTRLKERIHAYFPDMGAHKQGREMVLVCNKDVGSAIRKACETDVDNDAVHLAKAANIVRRDMFKLKKQFSGSFDAKCQEESVPISLLVLVYMVLNGTDIKTQLSSASVPQPTLSLAQLLMFNCSVRRSEDVTACSTKYNKERETPLLIYQGVMAHTKTRKLVDTLYDLGLSVSYDRVLNISTELGNNVCRHYEIELAVCPPQLKGGLFTTAAIDNIDHNPLRPRKQ